MEVKTWNEEIEKERVNAKAMKRKFSGVGLGYEDQPGAMLLGVWGEPMWNQDAESRDSAAAFSASAFQHLDSSADIQG